jgi:hypothetical protein
VDPLQATIPSNSQHSNENGLVNKFFVCSVMSKEQDDVIINVYYIPKYAQKSG